MRDQFRHRRAGWAVASVLVLALAACNGARVDKSGATLAAPAAKLHMLVPSAGDPEARYFAAAVARDSGGRLSVQIDSATYPDSDPRLDLRAADALSEGQADLGFVAGREWAQLGDSGFAAVQSPFLVTTMSAAVALTRSPIAQQLLAGLAERHVVGLALSVQEPRQLLTTRPFFGSDLGGARIRVVDNDLTARFVRDLGGTPVEGLAARQVLPLLASGRLDGAETSPLAVLDNAYSQPARFLTAYGLFPKLNTLVASSATWARLSTDQRDALQEAANDTSERATTSVPAREDTELQTLCHNGLVIDEPGPAILAALARRTAGPSPSPSSVAGQLAHGVAGLGAKAFAVVPPAACVIAHSPAQAQYLARQRTTSFVHRGGTTIPSGTYVTTDTPADFGAGDVYGPDWNKTIVYTQIFYPDGRFVSSQVPGYPDQPVVRGHYTVHGTTVTFRFAASAQLLPETVRWSYYGGQLTFAVVNVPDSGSRVIYLAHPWRKVR